MLRRFLWIVVAVPLAFATLAVGTAVAFPAARNLASAFLHSPDRLPAIAEKSQVHFETGAEDYAREVSALLPAAIVTVEAAHGRPFAHPVAIGAYATPEAFAAANGTGVSGAVGSTVFGSVTLSPTLNWTQHRRLGAILIHEMSHAHLQGYLSSYAWIRLPVWFKEGLAVMVSRGGGAEFVSEDEARAAIEQGQHIAIDEIGSFSNLSEIRFDGVLPLGTPSHRTVMAYRQAGMFVSYLHDQDPAGFNRMMSAILDGSQFSEAIDTGYHRDLRSLWNDFAPRGARDG